MKSHLRITHAREDAYLTRVALVATQFVEKEIGRSVDSYEPVPVLLEQLILLVAGHLYAQREGVSDRRLDEVPLGVQRIIHQFWQPEVV